RRLVLALFAAISVVAVVVSALAIRADEQARRADEQAKQAREARNATRVAAAREQQADPTTVLALLREIEPGSTPRGWAELAHWAQGADVVEIVFPVGDDVRFAAFSPDGRRVVAASLAKTVRVWTA